MLKITDKSTGAPEDKPGVWIEGGVDSDEVTSAEAALATAHRLPSSKDADTQELLRTLTIYIVPDIMPDTGELCIIRLYALTIPRSARSTRMVTARRTSIRPRI